MVYTHFSRGVFTFWRRVCGWGFGLKHVKIGTLPCVSSVPFLYYSNCGMCFCNTVLGDYVSVCTFICWSSLAICVSWHSVRKYFLSLNAHSFPYFTQATPSLHLHISPFKVYFSTLSPPVLSLLCWLFVSYGCVTKCCLINSLIFHNALWTMVSIPFNLHFSQPFHCLVQL